MFDFSIITQWFDQLLRVTVGCPDWLAILIEFVLVGAFDPMLRGQKIADLIATCAAIDVVIPDIDR